MGKSGEQLFLGELLKNQKNVDKNGEKIRKLAAKHNLPLSHAEGVSSFYLKKQSAVHVCTGLPCALNKNSSGRAMQEVLSGEHEEVSCLGYCDHAPVIVKNGRYYGVSSESLDPILQEDQEAITGGRDLFSYTRNDGLFALANILESGDKKGTVELLQKWKVRGMGGAGFPTYIKWKALLDSLGSEKYLIINAHEGEPGTFKDRTIMETRPYELLEAAVVVAQLTSIKEVIIALKYEYLNAEKILQTALRTMADYLARVMPDLKLPAIKIMRIPGYYVTGEETALLEAIEGRRSEPRIRPPFPAEAGLYGCPTLIDNVETLVYVLELFKNHFKAKSSTAPKKTYCLTGDVNKAGAYLVDYGISAHDLLYKYGETSPDELKALFPGGLSGGIVPANLSDVKLDFDSVRNIGAGLGTGSMIAISKDRCIVDVLGIVEGFFEKESCGKCIPCRLGTQEISAIISNLQTGRAGVDGIDEAQRYAATMISGSLCGLGQAAGRIFLDSLKHFRSEIEGHTRGICESNVCFKGGR